MKTLLLTFWLSVPLAFAAYHYGPGQDRLKDDAAAGFLKAATGAAAAGDHAAAVTACDAALAALPADAVAASRQIRLLRAKERMPVGQLPEAHDELDSLLTELSAIERALTQGKPVLGICLGAQLLAHVLGAPIRRLPVPEIGWYELELTAAGRDDAVFGGLSERAAVFQWHSYGFDLPHGAEHLARSTGCPHQAFRAGRNAYGFQFHLEMDAALIERWLSHPDYREELACAGLPHDAGAIRSGTERHIGAMQQGAEQVFNGFLDLVGRPQRRVVLASREWV